MGNGSINSNNNKQTRTNIAVLVEKLLGDKKKSILKADILLWKTIYL